MDEHDFEKLFNILEIKQEYEEIKSIDEECFMITKECFVKVESLEKYLYKEVIKSIMLLKIDNASRILNNILGELHNEVYMKMYKELNEELLNILKVLKTIKQSKRNIDYENLKELKNYYLSVRFLSYYHKLLMSNYSVKLNEIVNLEKGIKVDINIDEKMTNKDKEIKNKIKKYYEVKNGKYQRN